MKKKQKEILDQLVEEKLFVPKAEPDCEHDYQFSHVKVGAFSINDYPSNITKIASNDIGDTLYWKCTKCGSVEQKYK